MTFGTLTPSVAVVVVTEDFAAMDNVVLVSVVLIDRAGLLLCGEALQDDTMAQDASPTATRSSALPNRLVLTLRLTAGSKGKIGHTPGR
jgi:hypothetical protein